MKRPFDICFSLFGLAISAWLWALIAIATICEDGFPVLIRQQRIGRRGRFFWSYKFRSMVKSASEEKINIQASDNDPRITRVGRLLRKTALDELPQLVNILLGDMSFVGPRALLPYEVEVAEKDTVDVRHVPGFSRRCLARPGLTGIAQVFAPRDMARRQKFKYDLLYLENASFTRDLQLIALSFMITFKGSWGRRQHKLEVLKR